MEAEAILPPTRAEKGQSEKDGRDFPGGPMVKTLHFRYKTSDFDLWSGN